MTAFYNEIDPYAAAWLRNLIDAGHIASGVVDERSIVDIAPADLVGFTQVHFFAGIVGWSLAARLAGWSDDRPLWTGSCPCQPFSVAGAGKGQADERHLWPEFFRLIRACAPDIIMGEQVAAAVGKSWLDGVYSDLEGIGYATGATVVPACAVNAPHRRDRLWFVADNAAPGERRRGILRSGESSPPFDKWTSGEFTGSRQSYVENCDSGRFSGSNLCSEQQRRAETFGSSEIDRNIGGVADTYQQGLERRNALSQCEDEQVIGSHYAVRSGRNPATGAGFWNDSVLAIGADGKARRVKPGIRLLAHGIPTRVGKLRAFGNAIVPQVAAEIIGAYLDCAPTAPVLKLPPLPY